MADHLLGPVTLSRNAGVDTYTLRSDLGAVLDTRLCTAEESATITRIENADDLRAKATTALTNNAAFQAIASPTNAQALAQIQALTRQVNALIKLATNQLDDTAGT